MAVVSLTLSLILFLALIRQPLPKQICLKGRQSLGFSEKSSGRDRLQGSETDSPL